MMETNNLICKKQSNYLYWAKTLTGGKFNLATSGVENYSIKDLLVSIDDLEINGDNLYGYQPLQQAIAEKYKVEPDSVVMAMGTSMANHLVMASLLESGDEVLIEEPTYEPLLNVANYLGVKINRFSRRFENGFQIDSEDIKKNITSKTKLVVLANLHNPSGVFTDEKVLAQIGEITRNRAYVLVDEVYLETMFEKTPLSAVHLGKHFITTNSLTKVYGLSGLRCGWILAEPKLAKKMRILNDLFGVIAAYPSEKLSFIAFKNIEQIAQKAKNLLVKNHLLINQFIDHQEQLTIVKPDFGTTIFPQLNNGKVQQFCEILKENYETLVVPGKFFECPNHFRIGLGMNSETLSNGLQNIELALEKIQKL